MQSLPMNHTQSAAQPLQAVASVAGTLRTVAIALLVDRALSA
ncbi:hypothetical protein [Paraburkholderia jirisanensis]